MKYKYRNLQFRTVPNLGMYCRISQRDLDCLEELQNDGWEVYHTVNIRGAVGFTSHVLSMLRREPQ